jgi:hypothetical protein
MDTERTTLAVKGYGLQLEGDATSGYTLSAELVAGDGIRFDATPSNGLRILNTGNDLLHTEKGLSRNKRGGITYLKNEGVLEVTGAKGVLVETLSGVASLTAVVADVKGEEGVSVVLTDNVAVVKNTAPLFDVVAVGSGLVATLKEGLLKLVGNAVVSVSGGKGVVATVADGVATLALALKGGAGIAVQDDVISSTGVLKVSGGDGVDVTGTQDVVVKNTAPLKSVKCSGSVQADLADGVLSLSSSAMTSISAGKGVVIGEHGEVVNDGVREVVADEGIAVGGDKHTVSLKNTFPLKSVSCKGAVTASLVDGVLKLQSDALNGVYASEGLRATTADGVTTLSNEGVLKVVAGDGIVVEGDKDVVVKNDGVLSLYAGQNITLSASRGNVVIGATVPPLPPVDETLCYRGGSLGVTNKSVMSVVMLNADTTFGAGAWSGLTLASQQTGYLKVASTTEIANFSAFRSFFCDFDVFVDGGADAKQIEWGWVKRIADVPLHKGTNALAFSGKLRLGITSVHPSDVAYPNTATVNYIYLKNTSQSPLTVSAISPGIFFACG